MKIALYLSILLYCTTASAQNSYVDSLKSDLAKASLPTAERFEVYHRLIDWYRTAENFEEANLWITEQIDLAVREKNKTEQIKAWVQRGIINKKDYESMQRTIDTVSVLSSQSGDPLAGAYAGYLQAYRLKHLGEQESAVKFALEALERSKRSGDHYIVAKLNYLLYTVYSEWIDLENSRMYAGSAVFHAEKSGNKDLLSNALAALAVTYTYEYDKSGSKKDLDSTLSAIEKAADLYTGYPGQVSDYTYAIARVNKASYLLRYFPVLTPDIRKEIESNAAEVLNISHKLKNGQSVVASALGILSEIARRDEDPKLTEQYLLQAYSILLTQDPVYYHTMINVVRGLAELYASQGDFKRAFEYQQKITGYSSKLFDQNQAETSKRLEAVYRFEQKEQEMLVLEEKAAHHRRMQLLYAAFGLLGFVGAFFMFRSYHFRLRYSLAREHQLNAEKQEAETQVRLEKEEQARLKAEQELLTLRQQKLQDEVLANQLHIQHKNEVLQNLKDKLSQDSAVNINRVIREESMVDSDFEKAKFRIQELHPDFFKYLSEKAEQKLTSLDLKYCAYLYLGMDTKQIAGLLNVEPKSVRMAKYRLKKKYGLREEQNLEDFIKGIEN